VCVHIFTHVSTQLWPQSAHTRATSTGMIFCIHIYKCIYVYEYVYMYTCVRFRNVHVCEIFQKKLYLCKKTHLLSFTLSRMHSDSDACICNVIFRNVHFSARKPYVYKEVHLLSITHSCMHSHSDARIDSVRFRNVHFVQSCLKSTFENVQCNLDLGADLFFSIF